MRRAHIRELKLTTGILPRSGAGGTYNGHFMESAACQPPYNEGRRDCQTAFAITRFRYIAVLSILLYLGRRILYT